MAIAVSTRRQCQDSAPSSLPLLLRLELGDLPPAVPKLYGVSVHEVLGPLFRFRLGLAHQVYAVYDVAIPANDIRSIPVHRTPLIKRCAREIWGWGRRCQDVQIPQDGSQRRQLNREPRALHWVRLVLCQ